MSEEPSVAAGSSSSSSASPASPAAQSIALGSLVVLRKLGKGRKFLYRQVTVQADTHVAFKGSPQIGLRHLIGQRFGGLFKITAKGGLEPVTDASEFDQFEDQLVSDLNAQNPLAADPVSERDNRNIVDCSQNQSLSVEELAQLKQSGESGRSVIERLIDSSANFEQKTSFSQEKYVRKKKEKYLDYVAALEPSCRVLSELRGRGLNLRFDMLSQLVAYANVHCATRALVVDDSFGLMLSQAVCERLDAGSGGRLCLLTSAGHGSVESLEKLRQRCRQMCPSAPPVESLPLNSVHEALLVRRQEVGNSSKLPRLEAHDLLVRSDWDCVLVASRYSPTSLLPLLELLLPGRPFAFHSVHQDALVTLAEEMNSRGLAESLLLFDSFCRPWQLLLGRCRPAMRMEAMGSGFALVGRKSWEDGGGGCVDDGVGGETGDREGGNSEADAS